MWLYKDLTNAIKANGEKYPYTAVRKCKRCNKHQYKYSDWVDEELTVRKSDSIKNLDEHQKENEKAGDKT